jgi:hypothetical protein
MAGGSKAAKNGKAFEENAWRELGNTLSGLNLRVIPDPKFKASNKHKFRGSVLDTRGFEVGYLCSGSQFYKFIERRFGHGVNWHPKFKSEKSGLTLGPGTLLSKELQPDICYFNFENRTLYIVEIKFQSMKGSVDEKLQTADFKTKQYKKVLLKISEMAGRRWKLQFSWLLNAYFQDRAAGEYRDILEYLERNGTPFEYETIKAYQLGLTHSDPRENLF